MGDIFLKLLNMSISAGWLILAVLLLRLLLRRSPKWIHCLLWGIVAVRLTCPFSIESVYSLIPSAETVRTSLIVDGQVHAYVPAIDSRLPIIHNTINPVLGEAFAYEESDSAAPLQVYAYIAGVVWCLGVFALLAYAAAGRLRIWHMVKEAVCHRDNIYICDAVASPFILGIVRPRIYLPSDMNAEGANFVIAHEQAHLKRKDHWWKLLGYLLLAVYWFSPLCWAAYALLCRDIEFACDEKVIRDMALNERKEYSKALLSCSRQRRMVIACPLAFGEISVKERVKSVLNYKKSAVWLLAAAIAACIIVGICFLTNPMREYQIRVTIPAGCVEGFSYSDEEICPKSGTLTFYAGEGLGDTEISLLLVESREGNTQGVISTYVQEPIYMTPGWPIKFEVEKGAWYKIGVNVQNRTDEDKNVYVSVKNVVVRIADRAETDTGDTGRNPDGQQAGAGTAGTGTAAGEPASQRYGREGSADIDPAAGEPASQKYGRENSTGTGTAAGEPASQKYGRENSTGTGTAAGEPASQRYGREGSADIDPAAGEPASQKYGRGDSTGTGTANDGTAPQGYDTGDLGGTESLAVESIIVTNGNNGEKLAFGRLDSGSEFHELMQLYGQLNYDMDTEENSRVGYRYSMALYNQEGEKVCRVTPYKDGFTVDNVFYQYQGSLGYDQASVELMNYMDLLFYPAEE